MSGDPERTPDSAVNLFDRWDLDPSAGPQAITERLRERMEEADPRTAVELRRAWEELTMHPKRRIVEALTTFPETRPPVGRPPAPRRAGATRPLDPACHVAHAPVASALGPARAPVLSALPPPLRDPLLIPPPRTPSGGTK